MAERGKYNPETAKPVTGTLLRGRHRGTLFLSKGEPGEPGEAGYPVDAPELAHNALGIAGVEKGDTQALREFTRVINRLVGREVTAIVEEKTGTNGEFRVTDLINPEIS